MRLQWLKGHTRAVSPTLSQSMDPIDADIMVDEESQRVPPRKRNISSKSVVSAPSKVQAYGKGTKKVRGPDSME